MKNIKSFNLFENNNVKFKEGFPKEKVPVTLDLSFGEDQVPSVEKILNKLKEEKHVSEYKQTKATQGGDLVGFTIEFTSAYGVYLFGHNQAKSNPF